MASFTAWSILIILYQTLVCLILSWLVLDCRLVPRPRQPRELTLIKMLYLYEPETCGRIYYYNYSVPTTQNTILSNILFIEMNPIAFSFRSKMKLWVSLHVAWFGLSLLNLSQGRRPCGFYAILLPLTVTGIALLVVDLVHAALFLNDATQTQTESEIWNYIGNVKRIKKMPPFAALDGVKRMEEDDTSWISLLFAYFSLRGVVQWIINFWIVQDSYFDGLQYYRNLQEQSKQGRGHF